MERVGFQINTLFEAIPFKFPCQYNLSHKKPMVLSGPDGTLGALFERLRGHAPASSISLLTTPFSRFLLYILSDSLTRW